MQAQDGPPYPTDANSPEVTTEPEELGRGSKSITFCLSEDELKEIAEHTSIHHDAVCGFVRSALANHVFIRQAYKDGNEFRMITKDGKHTRVTFL